MTALYVAFGAAVGAPLRWWVDQWVQRRWSPAFPWGTFSVNVAGSFVLGVLLAAAPDNNTLLLLMGVGFCGALTTFSSFAWESYRLVEDGADLFAWANVLGSLVCCVAAAGIGYWVVG